MMEVMRPPIGEYAFSPFSLETALLQVGALKGGYTVPLPSMVVCGPCNALAAARAVKALDNVLVMVDETTTDYRWRVVLIDPSMASKVWETKGE